MLGVVLPLMLSRHRFTVQWNVIGELIQSMVRIWAILPPYSEPVLSEERLGASKNTRELEAVKTLHALFSTLLHCLCI